MKKTPSSDVIDTLIRIRYGKLVPSPNNTAYVSYKRLARLVNVSQSTIRLLMLKRLE